MNVSICKNGLFPFRIVFGIIPWFSGISTELAIQEERVEACISDQTGRNAIVPKRQVLTLLICEILPAADGTYKLGQNILGYSEQKKEWIGTFIVIGSVARMVILSTPKAETVKKLGGFQDKTYYQPYKEYLSFMVSNS